MVRSTNFLAFRRWVLNKPLIEVTKPSPAPSAGRLGKATGNWSDFPVWPPSLSLRLRSSRMPGPVISLWLCALSLNFFPCKSEKRQIRKSPTFIEFTDRRSIRKTPTFNSHSLWITRGERFSSAFTVYLDRVIWRERGERKDEIHLYLEPRSLYPSHPLYDRYPKKVLTPLLINHRAVWGKFQIHSH